MKFPFFLFAFIIFVGVITYKRKQHTHKQDMVTEAFIERERRANISRKRDISHLNYLTFAIDRLPLFEFQDEELLSHENILKELADKKIINLSNYSNTDLKLMYGPANLNVLSEYDENYHQLSSTLLAYANREVALSRMDSAIQILEYAMDLAIDSSQIYLLLADLYQTQGTPEKIETIIQKLSSMDTSFSSMVLSKLDTFHTSE